MITYQRKIALALMLLALIFLFSGCSPTIPPKVQENGQGEFCGLSVDFIDVGQGDGILIKFPDDKSMLIDCGSLTEFSIENVKQVLSFRKIQSLDYLVLTHPDADHVGGVPYVLDGIDVSLVYVPKVDVRERFSTFNNALTALEQKGARVVVSDCYKYIKGKDYSVAFLSPKPATLSDSVYRDFNSSVAPSEAQINDLSPYIYLQYAGARFLFTGDCSQKQESNLISDYNAGLYSKIFNSNDISVELNEIDFLKVSHHGSEDSSSEEFLQLLKPKNAVISVGGDNNYKQPSTAVLNRLNLASQQCALWRTDVCGTVSVLVGGKGDISVKTNCV